MTRRERCGRVSRLEKSISTYSNRIEGAVQVIANSYLIALMLHFAGGVLANEADPVFPKRAPRAMPDIPKPPYLSPIVDPVFGSRITRISGDAGSPVRNLDGEWGHVVRYWCNR